MHVISTDDKLVDMMTTPFHRFLLYEHFLQYISQKNACFSIPLLNRRESARLCDLQMEFMALSHRISHVGSPISSFL